jgi:hypothetical protein
MRKPRKESNPYRAADTTHPERGGSKEIVPCFGASRNIKFGEENYKMDSEFEMLLEAIRDEPEIIELLRKKLIELSAGEHTQGLESPAILNFGGNQHERENY